LEQFQGKIDNPKKKNKKKRTVGTVLRQNLYS
jgi:hypothetical protein